MYLIFKNLFYFLVSMNIILNPKRSTNSKSGSTELCSLWGKNVIDKSFAVHKHYIICYFLLFVQLQIVVVVNNLILYFLRTILFYNQSHIILNY